MNSKNQMMRLINGEEHDPHTFLGLHTENGKQLIRLFFPKAKTLYLEVLGKIVEAKLIHPKGIFEYYPESIITYFDYRIYHPNALLAHDPYVFLPFISELDQYLFSQGVHYTIYERLGAHPMIHQGIQGVNFAVWAPGATRVSLVADFNYFDGKINPMRALGHSGIFELFVPGIVEGEKYKFKIQAADKKTQFKADPYAFYSEVRPSTASIVFDPHKFEFDDDEWIKQRMQTKDDAKPQLVYELHLGSWKKDHYSFLNYRQIAVELTDYCKQMNFTHVELMPIQEHPLDESWGYQVTGYYAITSRFGTPEDFQWFVNYLHKHQIGIILDWVPAHFPTDEFSLGRFDGTALYEHEDKRQGFHPDWKTFIFNYGRNEVSNFLIANALFLFEVMHIDALRVDAVASMLYLDYGRKEGEYIPNKFGGNINLEAIQFFKHLNSIVHQKFPGVLMIAEESTSFPKITASDGLGFDQKWNLGWMNDTLRYFSKDMYYRHHHHQDLTFGLLYAFSERFSLALSHDEVVHCKKSLIGKMPGDLWQKFANLRLLYSYMICQPGKKLIFMGGEIAQFDEWSCKDELQWFLLKYPMHHSVQTMIKDLNHLYLNLRCLWEKDFDHQGFEWVDFLDHKNSVISYLRKGQEGVVLCVHHFTPEFKDDYVIKLSNVASIEEIFNSDHEKYSGSGKMNTYPHIDCDQNFIARAIKINLAPLSTMIFKVTFW